MRSGLTIIQRSGHLHLSTQQNNLSIDQYNRSSQSLSTVINSFIWRPAKDVSQYTVFPYTQNVYNFQHHFGSDKLKSVKLFKQSPFVNTEIRQMAERVLNNNQLGKRSVPDFLALTFYAGNYENALDKTIRLKFRIFTFVSIRK